jgi:hypothetical protein
LNRRLRGLFCFRRRADTIQGEVFT